MAGAARNDFDHDDSARKEVPRRDEAGRIWFRSGRVFLSGDRWYFHTREGIDVGPYDSQFEAEVEAGLLKELLRSRVPGDSAVDVIREFVLDSYELGRPLSPSFTDAR